jgi:hypothetical protein
VVFPVLVPPDGNLTGHAAGPKWGHPVIASATDSRLLALAPRPCPPADLRDDLRGNLEEAQTIPRAAAAMVEEW